MLQVVYNSSPRLAGKGSFLAVSQEPFFRRDGKLLDIYEQCHVLLTVNGNYENCEAERAWIEWQTKHLWYNSFNFSNKTLQSVIFSFPTGLVPDNAQAEILRIAKEWHDAFQISGSKFEYVFWNLPENIFGFELNSGLFNSIESW